MALADKQTLFHLAETQMLDQVKAKVKQDLIKEFVKLAGERIDGMLVEYAASSIEHMSDHLSMREEFVIWLKRDEGEKKKLPTREADRDFK